MTILAVAALAVDYRVRGGAVMALDQVTLDVGAGEVVGIVGESGSGKSTLGSCVGRLLPRNAHRVGGDLRVDGRSVFDLGRGELRALRAERLGFVHQSPFGSLDPTMRVGRQLDLTLSAHGLDRDVASHLVRAGLPDPSRVARMHPHQLSGGMAQRVAIAVALAHDPELIIADEPTASLDSTVRDLVTGMLVDRVRTSGATLLFLSHDLHSIRRYCDRVLVMYGGRIVEDGATAAVLDDPLHPYTRALLAAAPGTERMGETLAAIPGRPPVLDGPSSGCAFTPRCDVALDACGTVRPPLVEVGARRALCHRVTDLRAPADVTEVA